MDPQTPQAQAPQPQQTAQQTPPTPQPAPLPPAKKSGGFFGKLLLFVLIAGILLVGGYFLGTLGYNTPKTAAPAPTTAQTQVSPTAILPSPTPASSTSKIVKAGLTTSKAFQAYSIEVPLGWTDARETTVTADIDKLTLTKDGYSLTIYQAAMGGGGCVYPGDKPSEMAQSFTNFVDMYVKNGQGSEKDRQYRRSWTTPGAAKTISYTVCQKSTTDNSFSSLTSFGGINVVSPNPADESTMTEVDSMVTSMTNQ